MRLGLFVTLLFCPGCKLSPSQKTGSGVTTIDALPASTLAAPTVISEKARLIQTEKAYYRPVITSETITLRIVSRFTNFTPDTLTLLPCARRPPYPLIVGLDRLAGMQWRAALGWECEFALVIHPPILVPGQSRVDTLNLIGWKRPHMMPAFAPGPLAGVYRLHYFSIYRKWYPGNPPQGAKNPLGEELADSLRVSNVFRVVK